MYLGIDLGTSEVKLLLLADDHRIVATASERLLLSRPQPGWSEQDPVDWWAATGRAVAALRRAQPSEFRAIRAIGLSGQMHGAVLLDAHDRVLRPAILWNDTRSRDECERLRAAHPDFVERAGNLAMPGFTAPKLAWLARHEADLFARVACVLLPKDYLRLCLCGEKASDRSDAAGTLWLDIARRDWSDDLLAWSGMKRAQMPRLVEGSERSGILRPALADAWGLARTVAVAGGAGDNAATAVGMGAVAPGQGFVSLGTSGVSFLVSDGYRPCPGAAVHAFCHALPGRWHQMSVMLSAASCLSWLARLLGAGDEAALLGQLPDRLAPRHLAAPIFLPYLSGERTPHNDARARGVFFGLDHDTTAADLAYAVLEGVGFGLRDGIDALRMAGSAVNRLALVGGGSRSPAWASLLASLCQTELFTPASGDSGAALGAARLGWLADGAGEREVCLPAEVAASYRPDPAGSELFERRLERFRRLYRNLGESFAA